MQIDFRCKRAGNRRANMIINSYGNLLLAPLLRKVISLTKFLKVPKVSIVNKQINKPFSKLNSKYLKIKKSMKKFVLLFFRIEI